MSKKLVSKTLVALSILTVSGTLVNTIQSVEAHPIIMGEVDKGLKDHYSKQPLNIAGEVVKINDDGVTVKYGSRFNKKEVKVITENKYQEGDRVYVFTIGGEDETVYYGITKNKQEEQQDLITVDLEIKKPDGTSTHYDRFKIAKGETTMKEYDFRLRHLLVDKFGLYGSVNEGEISIKLNGERSSDIKLDKQFPRDKNMDQVINSDELIKVVVTLK